MKQEHFRTIHSYAHYVYLELHVQQTNVESLKQKKKDILPLNKADIKGSQIN